MKMVKECPHFFEGGNNMNKENLLQAQQWTEQELERCVSFWLKNGMDHEYGGV